MFPTRRTALTSAAALAATLPRRAPAADAAPKRIASVNSVYRKLSHAYHIAGRFLYGYNKEGQHHQPPVQMARMYTDQYTASGPQRDLSRDLARKKGFTVPVGAWLSAENSRLGPLLARQPCIAEIVRPGKVEALAHSTEKHAGFALWSLLFYALWYRAQIERKPMGGSVWEVLG